MAQGIFPVLFLTRTFLLWNARRRSSVTSFRGRNRCTLDQARGHVFQTLSGPLDRGLRHRSFHRGYHLALARAFALIESAVGALQEFLGCFAGSVIGPAAGILQAYFFVIELEFESFQAAQNVPDFFG